MHAGTTDLNDLSKVYIDAITFNNPRWIPCRIAFLPATWKKYGKELERIVMKYHHLFPDYSLGDYEKLARPPHPRYRIGRFRDAWECIWENDYEGLAGVVVESPLKSWEKFSTYVPPNPSEVDDYGGKVNWEERRKQVERIHENGGIAFGYFMHGSMFMRLFYLRGFENLMLDMALDDPRLKDLISMVLDYNMKLAELWVNTGVDIVWFGDDLGTQRSLMISPDMFRKYIKPCYEKIFGFLKEHGVYVYMHSDGRIVEIMEDLMECGVDVVNPQIGPNKPQELAKYKGRVCMDVDLDRQLFSLRKPLEVEEHIIECISALRHERGGLMIYAECEPETPLYNIETICATLSEICGPTVMQDFVQLQKSCGEVPGHA